MVAMTKEEMIQYLKDYANIQDLAVKNPDVSIGVLFDKYMQINHRYSDDNREYYDTMRRVYASYIAFKRFSITEDFLLNRDDFLNNNELDGISEGCKIYTTSPITNKKIVQLIRDAFNHNDAISFDRFRMSKNGRFFEIEYKDIRTNKEREQGVPIKPFRMKFDIKYLNKVMEIINEKRQNTLFLSFDGHGSIDFYSDSLNSDLGQIKFIHYYFTNKLSSDIINDFNHLGDTKGLSLEELKERSEQLHSLSSEIGNFVSYDLNEEQIEKLKTVIDIYIKYYPGLLEDHVNSIMYYFLSKVIPVPSFKLETMKKQFLLSLGYFADCNFSINEVSKRILRVFYEQEIPDTYDEEDVLMHNNLLEEKKIFQLNFYKDMLDGEFLQAFPIIMYIDSVVTHFCSDDEITIDGVTYPKEKLRNSFAHARWFISSNKELVMYDAHPKNINDYNLELVGKIDVASFEEWANSYMNCNVKTKKLIYM